jgi:hypothetical protein
MAIQNHLNNFQEEQKIELRTNPILHLIIIYLTLKLLTTTIVAPPSNASKWQMGFNSAFKGLNDDGYFVMKA